MSAPVLELRDVVVVAAGREILSVPRLALPAAATTAVLGANGAGKSTLLRVAGSLLRPSAGTVLLDGVIAGGREARLAIAAVLQRPLLRRGTVRTNAETGLRFRGIPRAVARRRADEWLERLGIASLADRQAHTLSGGEAQRVSLARAFAVAPRMLLLDEPFAALDAPTRAELLADLRDLLAETQTAALLVTHDRHEAAALADRVAVLHEGTLRQHGPAAEVLDAPADADCARLLGFETIVPAGIADGLLGEGTGNIVLRPEDCTVEPPGRTVEAPDVVRLTGALERVVPLGPVSRVTVTVADCRLLAAAPTPTPAWLARRNRGDDIVVRFDPRVARRLDGQVERRGAAA